jgi:GNAT superfamily N-acetyltransferase
MATLRPAVPADREFLMTLTTRLGDFPVPAWRTPEEIARADDHLIEAALETPSPETLLLIAEGAGGTPVGALLASTRSDYFTRLPHAHIEIVAVVPEAAGQGVAKQLMQGAEMWARTRGYTHVTLNVFAANTRAQGMYVHLGYHPETLHFTKRL